MAGPEAVAAARVTTVLWGAVADAVNRHPPHLYFSSRIEGEHRAVGQVHLALAPYQHAYMRPLRNIHVLLDVSPGRVCAGLPLHSTRNRIHHCHALWHH